MSRVLLISSLVTHCSVYCSNIGGITFHRVHIPSELTAQKFLKLGSGLLLLGLSIIISTSFPCLKILVATDKNQCRKRSLWSAWVAASLAANTDIVGIPLSFQTVFLSVSYESWQEDYWLVIVIQFFLLFFFISAAFSMGAFFSMHQPLTVMEHNEVMKYLHCLLGFNIQCSMCHIFSGPFYLWVAIAQLFPIALWVSALGK